MATTTATKMTTTTATHTSTTTVTSTTTTKFNSNYYKSTTMNTTADHDFGSGFIAPPAGAPRSA
eukprot:6644136-Pyramimonas_sp.AAC.1